MKAKKVVVTWNEVKTTTPSFTCPKCKVTYQGFVNKNSVQINCECGQLLSIVHKKGSTAT
jgi:hypothetical protein